MCQAQECIYNAPWQVPNTMPSQGTWPNASPNLEGNWLATVAFRLVNLQFVNDFLILKECIRAQDSGSVEAKGGKWPGVAHLWWGPPTFRTTVLVTPITSDDRNISRNILKNSSEYNGRMFDRGVLRMEPEWHLFQVLAKKGLNFFKKKKIRHFCLSSWYCMMWLKFNPSSLFKRSVKLQFTWCSMKKWSFWTTFKGSPMCSFFTLI